MHAFYRAICTHKNYNHFVNTYQICLQKIFKQLEKDLYNVNGHSAI